MKLRHFIGALGFFLPLIAFPLAADERTVDVETAVGLALRNNLSLRAEQIDMNTLKRAKTTSWNAFLPSISVGVGLNRSGEDEKTMSSPWDMSASVRASLPLSAASKYHIESSNLSYEAFEISLEDVEKQLVRDVKKAFYTLIVLREEINLIEDNIETAQKRYERAKTSYEKGLIPELDMLSAQVTLENLKPDLEEAILSYETAELQFKQSLGLTRGTKITVEGSIEQESIPLDTERLIQEHLPDRLDVQSTEKNIQVLENQKKLARAEEYTPVLSLSYSYTSGLNDPFHSDLGSAESWSGRSTVGLSLSLPLDGLIPGSSSRVKVAEIDDSIEKAHIEHTQTQQLGRIEIEMLVLKLEKSMRTIAVLEKNVALAQKSYDLTEKEYNAGIVDLLEVEDANDVLQEAMMNIIEERYNYLSSLFDLEYSLNTILLHPVL
jgi:outer membrane protein TolC